MTYRQPAEIAHIQIYSLSTTKLGPVPAINKYAELNGASAP